MIKVGDHIGRLLVLAAAERRYDGAARWLVRCDCGREKEVYGAALQSGGTRSCGCLRREYQARLHAAAEQRRASLPKLKRRKQRPRKDTIKAALEEISRSKRTTSTMTAEQWTEHYARINKILGLTPGD